jgi:hypothetical protein
MLGLESARKRNSRPGTKFRRGVWGETLFKGVPPQKGFSPEKRATISQRIVNEMKVTIAQLNPVVGDISGNITRIVDTIPQGVESGRGLLRKLNKP